MFDLTPGFTAIPNDFLDQIAPTLTAAELRVALYIYRHTIGYQKLTDAISYSQFTDGITTTDRRKLDAGAGVSRRSLPVALAGLERRGIISRSGGGIGGAVRYTIAQLKAKAVNKSPEPEDDSGSEPEQLAAPVAAPQPVPGQKLPASQPQPGQNLPAPAPQLGQKIPPTIETESKINTDRAAAITLILDRVAGITPKQAEKLVSTATQNQRDISYIERLVGYVTNVAGNPAAMLTVLINRNEDRTTTGPNQSNQQAGATRYINRQTSNQGQRRNQPIDFSKPIYQRFISQNNSECYNHSNLVE